MISRAYHDTLFMARVAPAGMIFIPCKGGISHRPDESVEPADIARGVLVLALDARAVVEQGRTSLTRPVTIHARACR